MMSCLSGEGLFDLKSHTKVGRYGSMPLISVIMGVKNGERTLKASLESLCAQTFRDFEVIACDDGSSDGTYEILSSFRGPLPGMKILRNQESMGLGFALNKCIHEARGNYLARQDADDESEPTRFEEQLRFLDNHPEITVLGTYARIVDEEGTAWGEYCPPEEATRKEWLRGNQLIHPSVLMRTADIKRVASYDPSAIRLEDYDLWLRLLGKGARLVTLPRFLYRYRWALADYRRKRLQDRIGEVRMLFRFSKQWHIPLADRVYCLKPLVAGLVPDSLLYRFHRRKWRQRA